MAIGQVQLRKRRCGPKVRTGCGTCKVRRVKCDETKPSCKRCTTTGRACDGYSSDISISTTQTLEHSPDLIQRIAVHIPGNTEEKRGFDFFLKNTAAELSGYYDSSFWQRLILAASAQKPALRHAVIALGALHEDFSRMKNLSEEDEQTTQFALSQYAKALGALRRSLASGKEDPLTALMSCVLFVCFDSLRGCYESAVIHLQSGVAILEDMRQSSTGTTIAEDNMAPLLMRLSIQSCVYMDTKSTQEQMAFAMNLKGISGKDHLDWKDFNNLEGARNTLDRAANDLFQAFYMWDVQLPIMSQSTESLTIFDKARSDLFLWNIAFEKFLKSKSQDFTNREVQGAALLKIHHTTANIMAGVRIEAGSPEPVGEAVKAENYRKYVDDFKLVVNLARPLVATAERDGKNGKPSLTFSSDFGLIGPLYYACINCLDVSCQKAAMELLLRCPRREGMWNSVMVSQMIKEFWNLKAEHDQAQTQDAKVDEYGLPLPFEEFTDNGAIHFSFYGQPTVDCTISHPPLSQPTITPKPASSPSVSGEQLVSCTNVEIIFGDQVLENAIAEEQEWQADNVRELRESVNHYLSLDKDDRRGIQISLEKMIATGVANILDSPSLEGHMVSHPGGYLEHDQTSYQRSYDTA